MFLIHCTSELISAPNIITYLQNPLPFDIEKLPRGPNPILKPEYLYLLGIGF